MNTEILATLTADELFWVRSALADSGSHWHHLWQDVVEGKRDDLDAEACRRLSRQAWDLWKRLAPN